eukprot:gb/GECH01004247.1/.p1 GENE.gb/GECH01004247.1/~~gb/GECH01004247.1/.p1  ORF type:complete len:599 (+),score=134.05 gb/GECH01004247.1/:1-1797(+)
MEWSGPNFKLQPQRFSFDHLKMSDKAVSFNPSRLYFPPPHASVPITSQIQIVNHTEDAIAFKAASSQSKIFSFKPTAAIVRGKSKKTISVTMKPVQPPEDARFNVQVRKVKNLNELINSKEWPNSTRSEIEQHMIPVNFFHGPAGSVIEENRLSCILIHPRTEPRITKKQNVYVTYANASSNTHEFRSLEDLYWAPDAGIVCKESLSKEIDMVYCPLCLGGVTSDVILFQRGRCSMCCRCPVCSNALVVVSRSEKSDAGYYFLCRCCSWSSLHLRLQDTVPFELFRVVCDREKETASEREAQRLERHYKGMMKRIADQEKLQKTHPSQLYQVMSKHQPQPFKFDIRKTPSELEQKEKQDIEESGMHVSAADIKNSPDSMEAINEITSNRFDLAQISSLDQRLTQPGEQSVMTRELWPSRPLFATRFSKRYDNRLLIKPELKKNECLDFPLNYSASLYVPWISVRSFSSEKIDVAIINPQTKDAQVHLDPKSNINWEGPKTFTIGGNFVAEEIISDDQSSNKEDENQECDGRWILSKRRNQIVIRLNRTSNSSSSDKNDLKSLNEHVICMNVNYVESSATQKPMNLSVLVKIDFETDTN